MLLVIIKFVRVSSWLTGCSSLSLFITWVTFKNVYYYWEDILNVVVLVVVYFHCWPLNSLSLYVMFGEILLLYCCCMLNTYVVCIVLFELFKYHYNRDRNCPTFKPILVNSWLLFVHNIYALCRTAATVSFSSIVYSYFLYLYWHL